MPARTTLREQKEPSSSGRRQKASQAPGPTPRPVPRRLLTPELCSRIRAQVRVRLQEIPFPVSPGPQGITGDQRSVAPGPQLRLPGLPGRDIWCLTIPHSLPQSSSDSCQTRVSLQTLWGSSCLSIAHQTLCLPGCQPSVASAAADMARAESQAEKPTSESFRMSFCQGDFLESLIRDFCSDVQVVCMLKVLGSVST